VARYKIRQARPSRVGDAAVQYDKIPVEDRPLQAPGVYHVTVTDRGRLVLPAEVRERLNIRDGDPVSLTLDEDGTISVRTRDVAIKRLRGMFKHLAPKDHFASDDLIAERRREARMEDRKFGAWAASRRRSKKPR